MAYSDNEKAEALTVLASCDNDYKRAVAFCRNHLGLHVSDRILRYWQKGDYVHDDVAKSCEEKKEAIADLFEAEIREAMIAAPNVRGEAAYRELITGAAILTDKMQLLRGQATTITQTNLSDDERAARVRELYQKAMERKKQAIEAEYREESTDGGE